MIAEDNGGPIWDPTAPVPVRPITEAEDHEPRAVGWRMVAVVGGGALLVGMLGGYGLAPRGGVQAAAAIPAPTVTATQVSTVTAPALTSMVTQPATQQTATSQVTRTVVQRVTDRVTVPHRVAIVRTVTVIRPGAVTVIHVTATRTVRVTVRK